MRSRILVEINAKDIDKTMKMLNVYAPYSKRSTFWDNLEDLGVIGRRI